MHTTYLTQLPSLRLQPFHWGTPATTKSMEEPSVRYKVFVLCGFSFTANTVLLLGRNVGATLLLESLGASALPYCMVLVGLVVLCATPAFSAVAAKYPASTVMSGLTAISTMILACFAALIFSGLAKRAPQVVFPLFFVCEETIVTLLMVVFWSLTMSILTPAEAKANLGIVTMGSAFANVVNGVIVRFVVALVPGGAHGILPVQMLLLLLLLGPNAAAGRFHEAMCDRAHGREKVVGGPRRRSSFKARKSEARKNEGKVAVADAPAEVAWWQVDVTQLIAAWSCAIVVLFSCIEFQYNAILASQLDADGIAKVTADLASISGVGQAIANLVLTPFLLQHAGVLWALIVTPLAYAGGELSLLVAPSVATAFGTRAIDFTLRYTINDASKQMLFFAVPKHHAVEARAFIDGTLKKASPAFVGLMLIVLQAVSAAPSEALVRPLAVFAIGGSLALLPLCARLEARYRERVPPEAPVNGSARRLWKVARGAMVATTVQRRFRQRLDSVRTLVVAGDNTAVGEAVYRGLEEEPEDTTDQLARRTIRGDVEAFLQLELDAGMAEEEGEEEEGEAKPLVANAPSPTPAPHPAHTHML